MRTWLTLVLAAITLCGLQVGRIAVGSVTRHEQTSALALQVSRFAASERLAGPPASYRGLPFALAARIQSDKIEDQASLRGLMFWLGALAILVFVEARWVAKAFIPPPNRSTGLDRLAEERETELRIAEAREHELRTRNRELERLAQTDALTGLPNRRAFVTWLRRKADELAASGTPLGVLMIDIDHFKQLNDAYGHAVGDEALRLVANTIHANVRGTDMAARYGGEEFVVLLPGANEVDAAEVAEVIRDAVAGASWDAGVLRVSVGAVSGVPQFDGDALIRAADRALYEAKRAGRNRTVVGSTGSRVASSANR